MKKCVVLLSGGMDSVTLLHYAAKELNYEEIYALSFNYGQKHNRELKEAAWQCQELSAVKEHHVLDISFLEGLMGGVSSLVGDTLAVPALSDLKEEDLDQPNTYVPNRNMILLSLAASYAEGRDCLDIFYGAQAQDEYGYWDCTVDFLERINDVLNLNRRHAIQVQAPFIKWNKAKEIELGQMMNVDYSHTWTCYRGEEKPCLECPSCVERIGAFAQVGFEDPLIS